MSLSIEDLGDVDRVVGQWCLKQVPAPMKNKVDYDYEVDGQSVVIFEVRPAWDGAPGEITRRPIVKFRYFKVRQYWQIYWMRASGKWELYEPSPTARNLEGALKVVNGDHYGCFFG